jgi:hypothetical protein
LKKMGVLDFNDQFQTLIAQNKFAASGTSSPD